MMKALLTSKEALYLIQELSALFINKLYNKFFNRFDAHNHILCLILLIIHIIVTCS